MLNTHLMDSLAKLIVEERVEERRFDKAIRNQRTKQNAQRNLRREIERLLEAEGSVQSVLDVLENVSAKTQDHVGRRVETICCS